MNASPEKSISIFLLDRLWHDFLHFAAHNLNPLGVAKGIVGESNDQYFTLHLLGDG
ncbi:hypothetical protein RE6C_05127 [Rhodopirellula europaea 6C]|uniref:Uncharacterized protein n=1 Tax=Rhodopirellula europaea 6C TaxID=1263867 RepID=M2AX51_9BACT|nr:hypothetical protein RE6C_05127 [Rhodopirellula europaea 6C]